MWAALHERADVLFDGLPAPAWPAPREEQPPVLVAAPWPFTARAGAATSVTLRLHSLGGATRVDLRHAGWGDGPAWEEAVQGHFAGWLHGFALLGLLIETGADARVRDPALRARGRYLISGEIPAAASPVYRALTDPLVRARWSDGVPAGEPVERIEDRLVRWRTSAGAAEGPLGVPGPSGELVAVLRPTPRGTHLALAEYGVTGTGASARWPAMFERLARFLG